MKNTITRAKGGTGEREVAVSEIEIPDLWHVAQAVRLGKLGLRARRELIAEMILETWHLAHDLKRHIEEKREEVKPKLLGALRNLTATARTFRNVPKDEQEWTSIDDDALNEAFDVLSCIEHVVEG